MLFYDVLCHGVCVPKLGQINTCLSTTIALFVRRSVTKMMKARYNSACWSGVLLHRFFNKLRKCETKVVRRDVDKPDFGHSERAECAPNMPKYSEQIVIKRLFE
jgi:hypothetical protein